jgi:CheY-like chemotaxis protein
VFIPISKKVFTASNGSEGIEIVLKEEIDLVISDVQMPVMTGLELLKSIRAHNPKIPIVVLATGHSHLTEEMATEAGASGLIHKPFRLAEIKKLAKSLLENYDRAAA